MAKVKKEVIYESDNDRCYRTGIYNDRCNCSICEWKYECSGSDDNDEEED